MPYNQQVPAAERTLQILELLTGAPNGLTASELATSLGIPRSALYALLNTLRTMGYVTQAGARRPYEPGPRLQALQRPRPVGTNALILAFSEETAHRPPEETLALSVLSNAEVLILAEAPSAQAVRCVLPAGCREPAAAHPAGQVLLAGLSEPTLERTLGQLPDDLVNRLRDVRQQTVAQHIREDVVMLAVPICPEGQRPEAALLASVPLFRWDEARGRRILDSLRETAARISHRLGALTYMPYGTALAHDVGDSVAMPLDELQAFLEGPWAARLACIRPDGSPHVVPIWYEWRDEAFLVIAWPGSLWADFVAQNPAVALTIDEPWPPMRRILVRGQAQLLPPERIPGGIEGLYRRLSARYLGAPAQITPPTERYGTGWQAFRICPAKMIAQREQTT